MKMRTNSALPSELLEGMNFGANERSAGIAAAVLSQLIGQKVDFDMKFHDAPAVGTIVHSFFESFAALDFF